MCHPEMAFADDLIAEQGGGVGGTGGNCGAGGSTNKQASVSTATMTGVADVLDSLWTLMSWLDRPPFNNT